MAGPNKYALAIGAVVIVVILLVVLMRPNRGKFAGAPDPRAAAEEAGLKMMSWRGDFDGMRREGPSTCGPSNPCRAGGPPSPGAYAEEEALRLLSWRPEGFQAGPREGFGVGTCAFPPAPAAIADAGGLQAASALSGGAPYFREPFMATPPCGVTSPAAISEAGGLRVAGAVEAFGSTMDEGMGHAFARRNLAAAEQFHAARAAAGPRTPFRVSARAARADSAREGFGGPEPGSGSGWSLAGGSGPPALCRADCQDNCNGDHCKSYCEQACARG